MICTVHTTSCYELNTHPHTYTYYKFIQHHYTQNIPARQIYHRYQYINSKYTSPFFLNFTYCIRDTSLRGIIRNYDPIAQMYIFCPLTKIIFNVDESRATRILTARWNPNPTIHRYIIINFITSFKIHLMNSHRALKSTTSLKHSNCFGHFFKLNTSFVC